MMQMDVHSNNVCMAYPKKKKRKKNCCVCVEMGIVSSSV